MSDTPRTDDREMSLALYSSRCPTTDKLHDWRYATDAAGRLYGDYCVRCQRCQQKAIVPKGDLKHAVRNAL